MQRQCLNAAASSGGARCNSNSTLSTDDGGLASFSFPLQPGLGDDGAFLPAGLYRRISSEEDDANRWELEEEADCVAVSIVPP